MKDLTKCKIIDVACGPKSFWFDKDNKDVLFCDIRTAEETLCNGQHISINPDVVCDFTRLPFEDGRFQVAVFDPPHFTTLTDKSWMAKKYGTLKGIDWKPMIKGGFDECMRVLKPNGVLIFKWNEETIPVSEIIKVIGETPLFGHRSGKRSNTHWLCFMKDGDNNATN